MNGAEKTDLGWLRRGEIGWLSRMLMRWSAPEGERDKDWTGRWGEWLASKHLRRLGWEIVARNWTSRRGEVDLIAYDGDCLVFVEVKTRQQGPRSIPPEEAIDRRKLEKMEVLATEFVGRFELADQAVRLDVIAIETPDLRRFELRHAENVQDWGA